MHLSPASFLLHNKVEPNFVFFIFSDPAISPLHQPNELVIFELFLKHQITSSQIWVWWDKDLDNEPLKGMSMERMRVKEFENQRYKIVDESILLFSRFSLSKFSLEALYIL